MTSGEQNQSGRAQDEILAGKYVMGVLAPEARSRVEQRMLSDPAFARLVKRWQADLAALQEEEQAEVIALPARSRKRERQPAARPRPPAGGAGMAWNSAPLWRCIAVAAAAIAMVAVVHDSLDGPQGSSHDVEIAALQAPAGQVDLLAAYDAARGRLHLVPAALGEPQEKVLQLWLTGTDGSQHSLGTLPRAARGDIVLPADMRRSLRQGGQLAISLENPGGSATGAPTGPIVAAGPLKAF